jgi:Ca2+-binding EF-hand superfamily protein
MFTGTVSVVMASCLLQVFGNMDKDGNGTLDHTEFRLGIRALGLKLTNREVSALIR